jgi:DNA-binding NarL/FixJ family response regulator
VIRLLLADDDDCFVAALAALLATDGRLLVIGRAHNGREAVELATTHSPDVVLMDIDMPVMDGIEATRHIQATLPATQVIALSGTDDFEDRGLEIRAAGATDYIPKSRFTDEIIDAILRLNDLADSATLPAQTSTRA